MTDLSPPHGYTARPASRDDARAVAELMTACQIAEGDEADMTVDELLTDWEGVDLPEETVALTLPDGRIVAYGDLVNRRYVRISVYGYVHPDYVGQGLGAYLVHWGAAWARERMDRAPDGVQIVVEHYVRGSNEAARRLMEEQGYLRARTVYVMRIQLDGAPAPPRWPEGLGVRTFVRGEDDRAVYETGEEALGDTWSRPPGTLDRWMAPTRVQGFDPGIWFLAEDRASGKVVGLCLCHVYDGRGWVQTVGVRRRWRRRGLALALLHHAFGELVRRGVTDVSLSVDADSPTGAPRLYTRAGMHVDRAYLVYRKELRPGRDFSTLAAEE